MIDYRKKLEYIKTSLINEYNLKVYTYVYIGILITQ